MNKLLLVFVIIIVSGCGDDYLQTKTSEHEKKITELHQELSAANVTLYDATLQIAALTKRIDALPAPDVWIEATSEAFGTIQTSIGAVTVSFSEITPYASGSRIKVTFGNPSNANLFAVSYTLNWWIQPKGGERKMKSKTVEVLRPLSRGSWNSEYVVLEGTAPTELSVLGVSGLSFKQIQLSR